MATVLQAPSSFGVNEALDLDDSRYQIAVFNVGDLATEQFYTDSDAGRVIEVRRNGKEVVFQEDHAEKDPAFKPEIIPGGFVGHCINQNDQKYTYSPNPNGRISIHTLRTWRGIKVWTRKGETPNGRNTIRHGQRKFYDYNF